MENTKILKLVLKYKRYDMIESGTKTEEYRQFKESILNLLFDWRKSNYKNSEEFIEALKRGSAFAWIYKKEYDYIQFYRGYSKNRKTMIFKFDTVYVGKPKQEWSEGWKEDVFLIKFGKRISPVLHCHLSKNASCETIKMLEKLVIKAYTEK